MKSPVRLADRSFWSLLLTRWPAPRHSPHAIAFSPTRPLVLLQMFTVWELLYLNVQGWRLRAGDGGRWRAFGVQ